jgi:hypothetical protein
MPDQKIVKIFVKGIGMSGKVKDDDNRSAPEDKKQSGEGESSNS